MTKEKWKTLLNLIVTIITAIAASLTTQGCMRCSAAAPAAPRERMNACRMRGALLPSAPHDNTRQHERVFCYIVTLLHCYIKVVSQCSHAKPRAPLRLPWAMELLGLQPAAHAL